MLAKTRIAGSGYEIVAKTDGLLTAHTEARAELWQQSGIEVEGDLK